MQPQEGLLDRLCSAIWTSTINFGMVPDQEAFCTETVNDEAGTLLSPDSSQSLFICEVVLCSCPMHIMSGLES